MLFPDITAKAEATEPEPVRTWCVTFHNAPSVGITAHEHDVTAEGDVVFTTYLPDSNEVVSCSLARGGWLSVVLADKPSD